MATYKNGGKYLCEVVQQGFDTSPAKGTPFFFLKVKPLLEVDKTDSTVSYECPNYERTLKMWITEKNIDVQIGILRDLGFTGSSFRELDPENQSHFSFVGKEIFLLCKHEPYEDKIFDKFELPYTGGGKALPSDSKVASKLDNLFGRRLKSAAPTTRPAVAEPVVAAADEGDDSIPF